MQEGVYDGEVDGVRAGVLQEVVDAVEALGQGDFGLCCLKARNRDSVQGVIKLYKACFVVAISVHFKGTYSNFDCFVNINGRFCAYILKCVTYRAV